MNTLGPKHHYAQAVLTSRMSKRTAFLTYINRNHSDPSNGAYRLEQTQAMRNIMNDMRRELELRASISTQQLQMADKALTQLNTLLSDTSSKTVSQQLQILRLAKTMPHILKDLQQPTPDPVLPPETTKQLDRGRIVIG